MGMVVCRFVVICVVVGWCDGCVVGCCDWCS